MELLKLYRGNDNHQLSLHRTGDRLWMINTVNGDDRLVPEPTAAWVVLDYFEQRIIDLPWLEIKPVPLLVATFEGRKHYFETPADLQAHYSDPSYGLGDEPTRVADLLSRRLPVIFGRLTVYRERPSHFLDGLTHLDRPAQ